MEISGAQAILYRTLNDPYRVVEELTGKPPARIVVVEELFEALASVGEREVVIRAAGWRECVRVMLADMQGWEPSEGQVGQKMRQGGWSFRGVPVDTSLIR